jgi:hypothetical protein
MEKRNAVMWKEAAAPRAAVPRAAVPRAAMPRATMPSRTMHRRTVPSTAVHAHCLRRSYEQCSADCDRRCETSEFSLTHSPYTHGVLPTDESPHAMRYRPRRLFHLRRIKFCERAKRLLARSVMNNNSYLKGRACDVEYAVLT